MNIIELLDDLFQRAASADEPDERNFIRKHVLELQAQGVENPTARMFSNPAGDFGSLVNDRVTDANWESATNWAAPGRIATPSAMAAATKASRARRCSPPC